MAFKKSHPASPPAPIADSVRTLLPFLAAQPGHYITVHIHGFPYLVQQGDSIRLPFRMPGVLPGDVLRLNRASVIGSRDYTMKGAPHIDERAFECRATVLGSESEPLRIKVKTKRRQRRARRVKSKHRYTILRISELNINNVED
jgi:large subunit ribosomal protein L21